MQYFSLGITSNRKELGNTLEAAFIDKFAFTPVENKFEFVHAIEKKIAKIQSTAEITEEVLKHFCGSRGSIYIRSTTDLTDLLTNRNLLKVTIVTYSYPWDDITPMHVKFVENPNTIDAAGPLRDICSLFFTSKCHDIYFAGKKSICI